MQQVLNCGFQAWVDDEWPETLKNCLNKLWDMYNSSCSGRIHDQVEHDKAVSVLREEKERVQKKYSTLMADVNKFVEATEQRVLAAHMARIKAEASVVETPPCLHLEEKAALLEMEEERDKLKKEVEMLKNMQKAQVTEECDMLKNMLKSQADIMKVRQKEWEDERKALKEEKKKVEYSMFDLFQARNVEKTKLDRIKNIIMEE